MKKTIAVIIIAFALTAFASADDGSWNATYSLSEGSLYSETENADIALQDEILAFDGFKTELTRAAFFFSNTSAKAVTVQAGFPVLVSINLQEDRVPGTEGQTGYFFSLSKYGPAGDELDFARLVFGAALKKAKSPDDDYMEHSEEYFLATDLPVRREISAAGLTSLFHFTITQDGRKVEPTSVVIEAMPVSGTGYGVTLEVTFHFRHTLSFPARGASRVDVSYTAGYKTGSDSMGTYMSSRYDYYYILGTGRTWKGPIDRLYVAVPYDLNPGLPASFKRLGRMGKKEVYLAEKYEPATKDGISITATVRDEISASYLESLWFDNKTEAELPSGPAQDFVRVKGASSFIKDTAAVYTEDGVISKAGFGPLSLFDGVRQTAWCEGAEGDGVGEWVEFELKKDVEALDAQNGYNRSFTRIKGKNLDEYYQLNNRPTTVEIVSADGKTRRTLSLADVTDMQFFGDAYLPAGVYKLFIRDVYRGTKWRDTCLGEIVFHPASALYRQFKNDAFLKAHAADVAGP